MRNQFFVLFVVIISFISAEAKVKAGVKSKTDGSLRLEQHFANPTKDFSWMSDDEKAKYISFIFGLNVILERELSRGTVLMVNDNLKNESHFKWQNEFLRELFEVEEASAVFPLALIPLAAPVVSTALRLYAPPLSTYVMRQAPQAASWWKRLTSAKGLTVVSGVGTAAYVGVDALRGNSGEGAPPADGGSGGTTSTFDGAGGVASIAGAASGSEGAASGSKSGAATVPVVAAAAPPAVAATTEPSAQRADVPADAPATADSPAAAMARSTKTDGGAGSAVAARSEGSFCIFGGYGSRYKAVESRSFCPAPTEMVNNTFCAGKKINPSFLCQSFGLSKSRTGKFQDSCRV